MELWIKDVKYFKADRMSCNSYRANYFCIHCGKEDIHTR